MSEELYIFGLVGAVCGGVCGVVLVLGLKIFLCTMIIIPFANT